MIEKKEKKRRGALGALSVATLAGHIVVFIVVVIADLTLKQFLLKTRGDL